MNKLITGFSRLSIDALIGHANTVVSAQSNPPGSTLFATADPAVMDVITALNLLVAAKAKETSKSVTIERKARRKELELVMQRNAASCELIAEDDLEKLSHTGYELVKTPVHTHQPPATPQNLRIKTGPHAGAITVKVQPVPLADSYELQTAADPAGPWSNSITFTNSQKMIKEGLTRGHDVYARVRAISSNGPSEWSDIAVIMVI